MKKPKLRLWIVTVTNWDYDQLASAAVWAEDPDGAEKIVLDSGEPLPMFPRFSTEPAPMTGMVLAHFHHG